MPRSFVFCRALDRSPWSLYTVFQTILKFLETAVGAGSSLSVWISVADARAVLTRPNRFRRVAMTKRSVATKPGIDLTFLSTAADMKLMRTADGSPFEGQEALDESPLHLLREMLRLDGVV
jgi:hypothetical protein